MIKPSAGSVLIWVTLCCCAPADTADPVEPGSTAVTHLAIVGGTRSDAGFQPAIGALVADTSGEFEVFCTATLVSDRIVLTAAHCFANIPQGSSIGFFAGSSLDSPDATGQVLAVDRHEEHPDFAGGTPPAWIDASYNDIAVAVLAEPAEIEPARIVRPGDEVTALVRVGADALVVGYGQTVPLSKSTSGTKHQGSARIGEVGTHELYLEDAGPQKCHGDSGGPTLGDLDPGPAQDWRLIGVASRAGKDCTGGSIETRVDAHLSWIHEQGDLPCGSGSSPDCQPRATGEPCAAGWECAGSLCTPHEGQRICSQVCSPEGAGCPAGLRCEPVLSPAGGHACLPATGLDGGDGGGCAVAPARRQSLGAALLLGLALVLITATLRS